MKRITFIIAILALSVAFVSAQTETKKCCNKGQKTSSSCSKSTGFNGATTTDATGVDTKAALCPAVASGEACAHPEKCSFSHETKAATQCSCDQLEKKSWYKFWGSNQKCDHCASKNT